MVTKTGELKCTGELTDEVTAGPFYKEHSPRKTVLREAGIPGEPLTLTGYVFDKDCKPVAHAWLDFWHANGNGYYDNDGYRLRGHQFTDESGRYILETVVPGIYPGRTPHIHVKVKASTTSPTLTTQLFIPDLPTNKTDSLYEDVLLMDWKSTPGGKVAGFSFVINR